MTDDRRNGSVNAAQLEAVWERSLDAARNTVEASHRVGTPRPTSEGVRGERTWLASIGGVLRRLIPRRDRTTQ